MDILVVIDMQNDFIDGALGTPEAEAIVPNVVDRVKNWTVWKKEQSPAVLPNYISSM